MSVPRGHKRVCASRVAALVVTLRGEKALKDSDLAALFGLSLATLYRKIGRKLWCFQPKGFYQLPKARDRGRLDARPVLAFTQIGVITIAGLLGDDESLEIGMEIAHVMKTRRRASVHKKAPVRRLKDPAKTAGYDAAKSRLITQRLYALTKKIRH